MSSCVNCRNSIRLREDNSAFNNPPARFYLYGGRYILPENAEVIECFPRINQTSNRIVLVNGFQNATQAHPLSMPPRYSLYDPVSGYQLYEIAKDTAGRKVIFVKDECNTRKMLSNANQIPFRLYECLINDKSYYWNTERRDIDPNSLTNTSKWRRVLVQDSGNATLIPEPKVACNRRSTEYEKRKGHFKNRTKFICDRRPVVNYVN